MHIVYVYPSLVCYVYKLKPSYDRNIRCCMTACTRRTAISHARCDAARRSLSMIRLPRPPPLRLGLQPRPAAAALCLGLPRARKMAAPDTPETAQLPASPAAARRLPPPAAPAPVREGARAHAPRRPPQTPSTTICTASARRPTPGQRCFPPAPAPPGATTWASRRRPTACSTSSGAGMAVLMGAVWGWLGCMRLAALDAVMRRALAAPLLLSLFPHIKRHKDV
jgi:hypothetical protein